MADRSQHRSESRGRDDRRSDSRGRDSRDGGERERDRDRERDRGGGGGSGERVRRDARDRDGSRDGGVQDGRRERAPEGERERERRRPAGGDGSSAGGGGGSGSAQPRPASAGKQLTPTKPPVPGGAAARSSAGGGGAGPAALFGGAGVSNLLKSAIEDARRRAARQDGGGSSPEEGEAADGDGGGGDGAPGAKRRRHSPITWASPKRRAGESAHDGARPPRRPPSTEGLSLRDRVAAEAAEFRRLQGEAAADDDDGGEVPLKSSPSLDDIEHDYGGDDDDAAASQPPSTRRGNRGTDERRPAGSEEVAGDGGGGGGGKRSRWLIEDEEEGGGGKARPGGGAQATGRRGGGAEEGEAAGDDEDEIMRELNRREREELERGGGGGGGGNASGASTPGSETPGRAGPGALTPGRAGNGDAAALLGGAGAPSEIERELEGRPFEKSMLEECRSVEEYEKLNRISEGTYGVVFRAREKKTGHIFALKKIKLERFNDGFPQTSIREINVLLSLHHPNIVNVTEVVVGPGSGVFMVMEFVEHDVKQLLDQELKKNPLSTAQAKCLMQQLLRGIAYLHEHWVLHRDLKTSNLLYGNDGTLKICDFGLARQFGSPLRPYTPMVVTLWYRSIEKLLGEERYSTPLDMWAVGCIMAELLSGKPLFQGQGEMDQIKQIFAMLGTPNSEDWPGWDQLPYFKTFKGGPL
ncbi:cell division cycle 2-like protein [Monoraphidium neglectum]|uniref:Cell division cycle 2-like protein n=1 Tax=Monoraphidium neglectum TaxID=145388 RepID=A0A0D2J6P7_9CHLO|nr:cell division cycle 2-like protein [Monoraphidium neglectum]KIY95492.1 cell division cycle 2-like protein [Monoraphidium neglectum]|eukprot:XP_013894512.1 cell division cycle 2-like protein [Monoraphidium neglectum]